MKKRLSSLALLMLALPAWADGLPVVQVRPHPVDLSFPAEAVVEALSQATVATQVSGRVLEVRADAGQSVKKGQVLMRLDAREAGEAIAAAEARLAEAKLALERSQSLVQQKFLSQAALDKAKAEFDSARAGRAAAVAGQSHATVVAPISGVIAQRHTELGEMAVPGRPLFTLYAPGGLRVTASVPQHRLPQMRGVKRARVEFPELGRWVESQNVQLLPTVDAGTHVSPVRVGLPTQPDVLPGMFARVHFVLGQAERLTVPQQAVLRRGEVAAVYVQSPEGRLSLRQLRLGEAMGEGEVEVLAGLAAGEQVVTEPVRAGMALKAAAKP
ncbi:MAG: hypothetical protein RIR00_2288 [Pseudomonadota bacterium]|jgi:RND family efflux transporter MFP subunit